MLLTPRTGSNRPVTDLAGDLPFTFLLGAAKANKRERNTVRDSGQREKRDNRLPAQFLHLQSSDAPSVYELAFRETVSTVINEPIHIEHNQKDILLFIDGLPSTTGVCVFFEPF